MITRPTTDADIVFVLDRLCPQHRDEHRALGLNRGDVLALARKYLSAGESDTALVDGEPGCVFGVFEEAGVNTTWFLATEAYYAHGMPAVRHARRYLRALVDRKGPLLSITRSPHPGVARWLEVLGYRKMAHEGDMQIFSLT